MKFPNPAASLSNLIVANVAKKFLSSFLKAGIAVVIAVVAAINGIDPVSIMHANGSNVPAELILPIWGGFIALLNALVSAVKRAAVMDTTQL